MSKPIILTDVDGVLISWQSGLPFFAQKYGISCEGIQMLQYKEDFIPYDKIFGDNFSKKQSEELFKLYNASEYIKYLRAYGDAVEVVNRIKDQYDFISVSALSSDMNTILNRRFNLNAHFPDAFIDFFQCDADTPKVEVFQQIFHKYRNRDIVGFVDDLEHNIEDFSSVFNSGDKLRFHLVRGNRKEAPGWVHTVSSWYNIENIVKKERN